MTSLQYNFGQSNYLDDTTPPPGLPIVPFPDYPARLDSGLRFSFPAAFLAAKALVFKTYIADDLMQEAMLHLMTKWTDPDGPAEFPKDDEHFRAAWLKCIHDRAVDGKRRIARYGTTSRKGLINSETMLERIYPVLTPFVGDRTPPERLDVDDEAEHERTITTLREVVRNLVNMLPPKTADIVTKTFQDDLPSDAVARLVGMHWKSVNRHLREANESLRADLLLLLPVDPNLDEPWEALIRWKNARFEAEARRKAKAAIPVDPNIRRQKPPPEPPSIAIIEWFPDGPDPDQATPGGGRWRVVGVVGEGTAGLAVAQHPASPEAPPSASGGVPLEVSSTTLLGTPSVAPAVAPPVAAPVASTGATVPSPGAALASASELTIGHPSTYRRRDGPPGTPRS